MTPRKSGGRPILIDLAERHRTSQLLVEQRKDDDLHQQTIERLVNPMRALLDKQNDAVSALERKRETAYTELVTTLQHVGAAHDKLASETGRLAALAQHMRGHVRTLASKQYWAQFERAPDVVVMFVPVESALTAAMEQDPELHADALVQRVLIVTPTLLVAMLHAVAYGWQQEDLAKNAREIAAVGAELHERASKFVEHFAKVGASLGVAVRSYNQAVGSFETRMLVSARKLRELGVASTEDIDAPSVVEAVARELVASGGEPSRDA